MSIDETPFLPQDLSCKEVIYILHHLNAHLHDSFAFFEITSMHLSFFLTPKHPLVSHLKLFQIYRLHTTFHSILLDTKAGQLDRLNCSQFFYMMYVRCSCCSLLIFFVLEWERSYPSSCLGQTALRMSDKHCALSVSGAYLSLISSFSLI